MVHFIMNNNNNNNVWQLPSPAANSFAGDEIPMFVEENREVEPLPKRWKSSSSHMITQQSRVSNELPISQCQYNPLSEPSPLGLRLRKSPSLLELAQKRLNESIINKGDLPIENLEAKTKTDLKARTRSKGSSSIDKLKASHFPALSLRIGQWEYVSKHEGDLVAKCYFSKHKIVWEVLDGGLKKKFEINWADIVGLKANYAVDGLGSLLIVLDKPPLFFKEINPQPRKHTQWRATSDFTDGEASMHRQHFLQCAEGVLDKHYEKLIHCDTRLNFLSKQQNMVLNFPYFPPKASFNDQEISGNRGFNLSEIYGIANTGSSKTVESTSLGLIHQDISKETHSSSSGMSMDIEDPNDTQQLNACGLQPTMSISDLVNHIGSSLSEQDINPLYSSNAPDNANPKDMLENISQILLSDNQLTATSDEKTLMSRVNSLCCLLQGYKNGQPDNGNDNATPHHNVIPRQGRNDGSTLASVTQKDGSICVSTKLPQNYPNDSYTPGSSQMAHQDGIGNDNSNPESNQEPGISRKDSFADLLHQLPRIASLPNFSFDISESGEILK